MDSIFERFWSHQEHGALTEAAPSSGPMPEIQSRSMMPPVMAAMVAPMASVMVMSEDMAKADAERKPRIRFDIANHRRLDINRRRRRLRVDDRGRWRGNHSVAGRRHRRCRHCRWLRGRNSLLYRHRLSGLHRWRCCQGRRDWRQGTFWSCVHKRDHSFARKSQLMQVDEFVGARASFRRRKLDVRQHHLLTDTRLNHFGEVDQIGCQARRIDRVRFDCDLRLVRC